jgi:hypothetical protein
MNNPSERGTTAPVGSSSTEITRQAAGNRLLVPLAPCVSQRASCSRVHGGLPARSSTGASMLCACRRQPACCELDGARRGRRRRRSGVVDGLPCCRPLDRSGRGRRRQRPTLLSPARRQQEWLVTAGLPCYRALDGGVHGPRRRRPPWLSPARRRGARSA